MPINRAFQRLKKQRKDGFTKEMNHMAYCQRCGEYCQDHYTYCKRCYFELGQPFGKAIERPHKCRKCGCTIYGRYNYCLSCAQKKGFINKSNY